MQRRGGGHGLGAVLFTDIVGSTAVAAEMGNARWSELVARHHRIVRRELDRFGGREMDTAGDGFFATFERPADAIRCAVAAAGAVRELGIEIRAGVSFGELESVGKKASGLVVNTAARVMSVAGPGEVLVTASVREIVTGGGISFAEHGTHQLKGLEGEFRLFRVSEVDGAVPTPALDPEEAADRRREIFPTGSSRRRAVFVGVGAGVLALIAVGVLLATGGEPEQPTAQSGPLTNAAARIDPETGSIDAVVSLEEASGPAFGGVDRYRSIAAGEGGVWVLQSSLLLRVDPDLEQLRGDGTDVTSFASAVTTGIDAVWVQIQNTTQRIHPGTGEGKEVLSVPPASGLTGYSMAVSDAVWLGVSDGTLVRFDPGTGARDQTKVGGRIDSLAATRDAVWVNDTITELLTRLDPVTLRPAADPIEVSGTNDRIAATGRAVWLLDRGIGLLTRVSTSANAVNGTVRVGDDPTSLAVGLGFVWVGDAGGTLFRIDETTLEAKEFDIPAEVVGVAVDEGEGTVWIQVGLDRD
jgi:class 3 adenylate cyclase/streptogramin lyase